MASPISAHITALKVGGRLGWLTALRAPQIAALAAADGPLQMSLFDKQNFAKIRHPDYSREQLIVCLGPVLADEWARKRGELLDEPRRCPNMVRSPFVMLLPRR